jgi:hypothetical protein
MGNDYMPVTMAGHYHTDGSPLREQIKCYCTNPPAEPVEPRPAWVESRHKIGRQTMIDHELRVGKLLQAVVTQGFDDNDNVQKNVWHVWVCGYNVNGDYPHEEDLYASEAPTAEDGKRLAVEFLKYLLKDIAGALAGL